MWKSGKNNRLWIASFITVFGKNFQLYGTEGYAAPEALNGDTVTTASDIYSLGKVLEALARACTPDCSETLTHIIEKAADRNPDSRYQTATDLMLALSELAGGKNPGQKRSYLPTVIQKEIFCVSLICTSHKKHSRDRQPFRCRCNIFFSIPGKHTESQTYSRCYIPMDHSDNLISMTQTGISLTEHEGIFQSKNFTATPCYGPGIEDPVLPSVIRVRDFGTHTSEYSDFGHFDLTFILLSWQSMGFCRYTVFYQPA